MKRIILLFALVLFGGIPVAVADVPQDFLPPLLPWQGASESLVVASDHPWITPAERMGLTDTPDYEETVQWLKRLCTATPLVSMVESFAFCMIAVGRADRKAQPKRRQATALQKVHQP